jgi:hypothetical protein
MVIIDPVDLRGVGVNQGRDRERRGVAFRSVSSHGCRHLQTVLGKWVNKRRDAQETVSRDGRLHGYRLATLKGAAANDAIRMKDATH